MTEIKVIVTDPEEAYDGVAEFWSANELIDDRAARRAPAPAHRSEVRQYALSGGRRQLGACAGEAKQRLAAY